MQRVFIYFSIDKIIIFLLISHNVKQHLKQELLIMVFFLISYTHEIKFPMHCNLVWKKKSFQIIMLSLKHTCVLSTKGIIFLKFSKDTWINKIFVQSSGDKLSNNSKIISSRTFKFPNKCL